MAADLVNNESVDKFLDELGVMDVGDFNYQSLLKFAKHFYAQGYIDGFDTLEAALRESVEAKV